MCGGESVSQLLLKDKPLSTSQIKNHHLPYGRKMGFRLREKPAPPLGLAVRNPQMINRPQSTQRRPRTLQP
ncbi:hypothetical protein ACVIM8_001764 [Bradyrhizobium sp. USDA 4529]